MRLLSDQEADNGSPVLPFEPDHEKDEKHLYDGIFQQQELEGWVVDRAAKIPRGNYEISKILELIEFQFHMIFIRQNINLFYNRNEYRVEINPTARFAIACYAERSILQLMGFESQSIVRQVAGKRAV